MDIAEVAKMAKKHGLHSGQVSWPDDELEQLLAFANEIIAVNKAKEITPQK
jgi:hypothetical protein